MDALTHTLPTFVPSVTIYGDFPSRTLSIREALTFIERDNASDVLILGAMRPGYLGRETLTADDLWRWAHEEDDAAAWAEITDGERAMAEVGALR